MRHSNRSTDDLNDDEILVAPIKLLTPAQRKRRRLVKNNRAKERSRALRKKRMEQDRAKVIYCQGTTTKGEACGAYAMDGAKHCRMHLNDAERAKLGVEPLHEIAKRARLEQPQMNGQGLTAPAAGRQLLEVAVEKLLARYFRAVGFKFEGWDENGMPIVYDEGAEHGMCLYGESKEGYINMTEHPDLAAQIQVIEKLWDRVYGKPKQTQVLEGGVKPIQVQPVRTAERAQRVGSLLRQVGALPHEGRRRAHPPGESNHPGVESSEPESSPNNVVPLNDD